ncbi:MAG: hypothetical protein ABSF63_03410 [Candidatus Bathyarchaeia archaeon]|jgi:hypothetical protein
MEEEQRVKQWALEAFRNYDECKNALPPEGGFNPQAKLRDELFWVVEIEHVHLQLFSGKKQWVTSKREVPRRFSLPR